MMLFTICLFGFLSLVVVQQAWTFHSWLLSAVIYGLVMRWGFSWSDGACLGFFGFLAITAAMYWNRAWQQGLSRLVYHKLGHFIPKLSATEEQALKVGDPWLEEMIFQGNIDWSRLQATKTELTAEEQSFLDLETQALCDLLDEWEISQNKDLPPAVWSFIKSKGFLGLVIAKAYGGKGFSARAHSDIVMKIASRSTVAAITVMVPNSLGPGELLMHYGTAEQKQYYLPRLANGLELPCFALTEPEAGSDATSIQSQAVVCYQMQGKEKVLGLKVNLDKRWITLAPVASLIGAAVYLKDPEGLLNGCGQEGITCILIARDTPHLEIGARHIPAHQPFMNGTIRAKDLFIPITQIIGGQEQAGHGWKMLVECLSIGRSISLPTIAAASSAVAYLTSSAFSRMRRQFSSELLQFEGIQEKLASIAGLHYLVNVTRLSTLAAVDAGKKPAVASAMAKYFNTELARQAINDAMDLHGGRTVVEGPRNYLGPYYQGIPISVTVEGANVMSRNLLIFGQGSMVCHPYIKDEFYAIRDKDFKKFNQVFWSHVAYSFRLFAKALVNSWTGGRLNQSKPFPVELSAQTFVRLSSAFAWVADLALITLGGDLKRRERLSARLADAFSYLYLALGVFADRQQNTEVDEVLCLQSTWAIQFCYVKVEAALQAFIREYPIRPLAWLMRLVILPFGPRQKLPSDKLEKKLAIGMSENHVYRNRIKENIYLSGNPGEPIDRMEMALQQYLSLQDVYAKIPEIRKLKFHQVSDWLIEQVQDGRLTKAQAHAVLLAEAARLDAVMVDEFELVEKKSGVFKIIHHAPIAVKIE